MYFRGPVDLLKLGPIDEKSLPVGESRRTCTCVTPAGLVHVKVVRPCPVPSHTWMGPDVVSSPAVTANTTAVSADSADALPPPIRIVVRGGLRYPARGRHIIKSPMSMARVLTVAALVPWLAVSASLAPEHVHESDSPDHHAPVSHRHVAPHEHGGATLFDDHDDGVDGLEVSETDEDVVWIDEVAVAEATHSFPERFLVIASHIDVVRSALVGAAVVPDEATLPHGPPRVSLSLRAPPPVFL